MALPLYTMSFDLADGHVKLLGQRLEADAVDKPALKYSAVAGREDIILNGCRDLAGGDVFADLHFRFLVPLLLPFFLVRFRRLIVRV